MDETIIATYCLCDDLLKAMSHRPDPQCKMSDAEVMTTALTAALFFRGTLNRATQHWHTGSARKRVIAVCPGHRVSESRVK